MPAPLMAYLVIPLIKIVVILGVVIMLAAYLSFFERKILAYMQIRIGPNRVGPRGWLQPIADALKLFVKEDILPSRAEKLVYMLGPVLVTAPALVVFSVIPFGRGFTLFGTEVTPTRTTPATGTLWLSMISTACRSASFRVCAERTASTTRSATDTTSIGSFVVSSGAVSRTMTS